MERNSFIKSLGVTVFAFPAFFNNPLVDPENPLDKTLVQEFVGSAHRDKDKVSALLAEYPTLLNVAHDWGNGDFETALGAASHVGYKELVTFLIEKGAQTNIFTACLFGKLEIVKLNLDSFPATLHAKGPHGFTLLHHAIRGGQEAIPVKEYLESLGAVETKMKIFGE